MSKETTQQARLKPLTSRSRVQGVNSSAATHASIERGVEKDPTNFFSVELWGSCLCKIVLTTSLIAFYDRRRWPLILGIL